MTSVPTGDLSHGNGSQGLDKIPRGISVPMDAYV